MELNYGIRNHFLPVVSKEINLDIVPDAGIRFPTLHPCELFTTKINALIERRAVRDLFDVYSLSQSNMLSTLREREMLKKELSSIRPSGGRNRQKRDRPVRHHGHRAFQNQKPADAPAPFRKEILPYRYCQEEYHAISDVHTHPLAAGTGIYGKFQQGDLISRNSCSPIRRSLRRITDHPMAL